MFDASGHDREGRPEVVRSVWNDGPEDAVLIMTSPRTEDVVADVETVDDFWPE